MKKKIVLFLAVMLLAGCAPEYNAEDFIGKTSAEIVGMFGDFDCTTMSAGSDGLYRNCSCGYTLREPKESFLGTSSEKLFFIVFDENGVVVRCEEGPRPGG